jgi:ABC-type glutathione transport system ATPase component
VQAEPTKGQQTVIARKRLVPVLALDHVSKSYTPRRGGRERVLALDDVSFEIQPGSAVGLVGASGSGKTTIAKMVTGSEAALPSGKTPRLSPAGAPHSGWRRREVGGANPNSLAHDIWSKPVAGGNRL